MALPAPDHVTGLILAAGRSERLGRPKQLLPAGGRPLLEHVVAQAEASGLADVVVVVGPPQLVPEILQRVRFRRARPVAVPPGGRACSLSLSAGLGALDPRTAAVVVLPGDQPDIGPDVIDAAVAAWRRAGLPALRTRYRGDAGHPVVIGRSLLPVLQRLTGEKALWAFLEANPGMVAELALDREPPLDVDDEAAYAELLRRLARGDLVLPKEQ